MVITMVQIISLFYFSNFSYQKHKISKEEAVDGVDQVFKIFKDISARTCINHGDFQPKNILYDEKTGNGQHPVYTILMEFG